MILGLDPLAVVRIVQYAEPRTQHNKSLLKRWVCFLSWPEQSATGMSRYPNDLAVAPGSVSEPDSNGYSGETHTQSSGISVFSCIQVLSVNLQHLALHVMFKQMRNTQTS